MKSFHQTPLAPEIEFLLCCSRAQLEIHTAARIEKLLERGIDWDRTLNLARFHEVTQLVYWHLNALHASSVPPAIMRELRLDFDINERRNRFLTRELLRILDLFKAHNIPAIPYKGPVLALMAYKNLGLRSFGDLDILIHKKDVPRANELLLARGYLQRPRLNAVQQRIYLSSDYHYAFDDLIGFVTVEIHWAVWKQGLISAAHQSDLWERACETRLLDDKAMTLSPEDMLLLTCVHGTKHLWPLFRLVSDAAELIRACPALEWEALVARSQVLGTEKMLFLGLQLASDLLDAPLPQAITRTIQRQSSVLSVAERVAASLLTSDATADTSAFVMGFENYSDILRTRSARERARSLLWLALTPNIADYDFFPLPAKLIKLYYLTHPVLLGTRYLQWFLKRHARIQANC